MALFKSHKGFTLIELLIVIAIFGILASVVLASLNVVRIKSRDSRRTSDIRQLQIALGAYANANSSSYPTTLNGLVPTYIAVLPTDPSGTASSPISYRYASLGVGVSCSSYHLGATLEESTNSALSSDSDATAGSRCTGSSNDFAGTDPLFDVKP
ncbi:MAG: type II secretion system protein [Candidatus Paceibacterota bacterium]